MHVTIKMVLKVDNLWVKYYNLHISSAQIPYHLLLGYQLSSIPIPTL